VDETAPTVRGSRKGDEVSKEPETRIDDGVSIWGNCGEFSVPGEVWLMWLNLAQHHGWSPAGTAPPHEESNPTEDGWSLKLVTGEDGGYGPPYGGQIITRPDALELAAALERALIDIPDVPKAKELIEKQTTHMSEWVTPSSSIFERSAASKEYVKDFIIHCRDCSEFWLY
jgi:hypothetical protein